MMKTYLLKAYLELTKPRILSLVLVTTTIGFFLGGHGITSVAKLALTSIGAALVCAGASCLNEYLEREEDSRMERTKNRPIPLGVILPNHALIYGVLLVLSGVVILASWVNLLTAFLGLLTAFLYVLVYTPMKKLSWLNTSIGAIPGAIPPMGGWAAATGQIDCGAWILFMILFLWQHPHFYAIAWMYREDYKKVGFKMLPTIDPDGKRTFWQINLFCLLLIPVSVLPSVMGMSGQFYFYGALMLGVNLFWVGWLFTSSPSRGDAHKLLKASVVYLPVLLFLIVMDVSF